MRIETQNLRFSYGRTPVLRGIDLDIPPGGLTAVLGPNGSGKSTLFRCMLGILRNYSGTVRIGGDNILSLPPRETARRIAYIPQSHYPSFNYSVLDMVLMGAAHSISPFSEPGKKEERAALDALSRLGAEGLAPRGFLELSGGERQLVLIARALFQSSDILVMDEPASSLDYGNQLRLLKCVRGLADEGYTVLLSTHNPQHALSFASRIIALSDGGVAADGAPGQVLTSALIERLYGVRACFISTPSGPVLVPEG